MGGQAFPLFRWGPASVAVHGALEEAPGKDILIDTGYPGEVMLEADLFQKVVSASKGPSFKIGKAPTGLERRMVNVASLAFGGQAYSKMDIEKGPWNLVGLGFLSRNQVTINFPKKTMSLQPNRVASPADSFPNHFATALGWFELESIAPHFTKESLADDIVSPPNLHPADSVDWLYAPDVSSSTVSVNRPDATIRLIDLVPGNYHMKISSEIGARTPGDKHPAWQCSPESADPMVPIGERGTVFILHDYRQQKETMSPWGFLFAQAGYRTVLVDLRGHGESTGQAISYGKYEIADLAAVLDRVQGNENPPTKIGVFGVGYGAVMALNWAARDSRVGAIVAIAPYDNPEMAFQRMVKVERITMPDDVLRESLALVAANLGIDWSDWSSGTAAGKTKAPMLLIGGGEDTVSPANDIEGIKHAAWPGSKTLLIPNATHENIGDWIDEIAEPAKQWFAEHLLPSK
jgi:alpha-beta hydrolase superfamily lysophospholipase